MSDRDIIVLVFLGLVFLCICCFGWVHDFFDDRDREERRREREERRREIELERERIDFERRYCALESITPEDFKYGPPEGFEPLVKSTPELPTMRKIRK